MHLMRLEAASIEETLPTYYGLHARRVNRALVSLHGERRCLGQYGSGEGQSERHRILGSEDCRSLRRNLADIIKRLR